MSEFIDEGDDATNNDLKNPNSEKRVVEIKRMLDGESFLVDVDDEASSVSTCAELRVCLSLTIHHDRNQTMLSNKIKNHYLLVVWLFLT